MIGDGVIAESKISFKITWENPGNGVQPKWNQNKQEITLHESNLYPDLMYTSAQGLATYYTYTTIDKLALLMKQINEKIDEKLSVSEDTKQLGPGSSLQPTNPDNVQPYGSTAVATQNTELATRKSGVPATTQRRNVPSTISRGGVPSTISRGGVPSTIRNTPETPSKPDDITNNDEPLSSPDPSGASSKYTVTVHGDELTFIDAQLAGATIRVRHKVSKNLFRKINDELIDNTQKIWVEVKTSTGTQKFTMQDFEITNDGINLIVEILPTVDLVLTPGQESVPTKTEDEVSDEDRIQEFARLRRYGREEARYRKSKADTEKAAEKARKIKTKK